MFCKNCTYECKVTSSSASIWDFEPRNYVSYKEMLDAFRPVPVDTFLSKNEDGYTYFHWYIYYIGKVGKQYKKYYTKIMWFFEMLNELYPSRITEFLNEGMTNDPNYTCLHHLYKWCDNSNKQIVKKMETFLLRHNVHGMKPDASGFTYIDYKKVNQIPHEKQHTINYLIRCYKKKESFFFKHIFFNIYRDHFTFCDRCKTEINFIDDLETFVEKPRFLTLHEQFQLYTIILLRTTVNSIYREFEFNPELIDQHSHIVNLYKKCLFKH
jgi:hypothetical protein